MTAQQRQLVLDHFEAGEARLLGLVEGLTPEQWDFHESPDRWSIAQIVEHVITVERRILGGIQKSLASGVPPAERGSNAERDAELARMVRDSRFNKIQAPEPVRPTGKWTEAAVLITEFKGSRAASVLFTRETTGNLRGYGFPHIAFGELDCYQWLIILAGHTDRHASQIEAIKTHPGFPTSATATAA